MLSASINSGTRAGWIFSIATFLATLMLWAVYDAHPLRLLIAAAVYLLAVAIPGRTIMQRLMPASSQLQVWIFGSIIAEIMLGILLKLSGASLLSGLVLPALAAGVLLSSSRQHASTPRAIDRRAITIIIVVVLSFLGFFLYGQAHRTGDSYTFSYNPTVDLTYFQTVLTSISTFGEFKDLAHLGHHFNYPDNGYQLLSFLHRLSGAEAFDILFFFAPLKDFLLLSLAVYALLEGKIKSAPAILASIGFYIFSSRSLLDLNVPITNPAYREGLYILLLALWAHHSGSSLWKWLIVALAMIGLVLTKPAIWLVAAPSLLFAEVMITVRSKDAKPLGLFFGIIAVSGVIFLLLFSSGSSGLSGDHYTLIFGQGLTGTLDAIGKLTNAAEVWRGIVIRPLGEISVGSILLGLLLFIPFVLQQMQHAGRLVLAILGLGARKIIEPLSIQLAMMILTSLLVLAYAGMEYTSFVHVYLLPLALTASTILIALSFESLRKLRMGRIWVSLVVLGCLYDVGFAVYGYYTERGQKASVEVPAALIDEFREVRELTDTSSVLVTAQTGLFQPNDERSYLAAAFTERRLLSEGAIYGSLIMGYQENLRSLKRSASIDSFTTRRATRDTIYYSADPQVVLRAAHTYGITHIVIRHGQQERIVSPVGDTIFHGRMLTLLKL